jgi:hypothetical protein
LFSVNLLGGPADDRAIRLRHSERLTACELLQNRHLPVAIDKLYGHLQVQQAIEAFPGHWAWNDVASNHNLIYASSTNIREDCLKSGQVRVNIVDRSSPHRTTYFPGLADPLLPLRSLVYCGDRV